MKQGRWGWGECVCMCVCPEGPVGLFLFSHLREVSLRWTSPFLLVVTSVKDPPASSHFLLCLSVELAGPSSQLLDAAPSGPQTEMLSYSSLVPESTVPGKDVNSAKNLLLLPHPPLSLGYSSPLPTQGNTRETMPWDKPWKGVFHPGFHTWKG